MAIATRSAILRIMHRGPFTIELKSEEIELIDSIQFNPHALKGKVQTDANGELVSQLLNSFIDRDAIPLERIKYFTEPEYNLSEPRKSRRDAFMQKSGNFETMIRHLDFLKYLHYFIHGANLPPKILTSFSDAVKECGQITSGDIAPLSSSARQLVRSYNLEPRLCADEFYKLCLDLNLHHMDAASIRTSIKQIRKKS
ncbi:MAG: hypothetical protein ACT6RZ_08905 [Methylophilus sp.]|uniref:hypothetical protein n=1 Tax=Methylophilus sp. TaxID=29541 RepID=UPI0040370110